MPSFRSRSKQREVSFMVRPQFERGVVFVRGIAVPAVRFQSGIVHIIRNKQGHRVKNDIANSFQKRENGNA